MITRRTFLTRATVALAALGAGARPSSQQAVELTQGGVVPVGGYIVSAKFFDALMKKVQKLDNAGVDTTNLRRSIAEQHWCLYR